MRSSGPREQPGKKHVLQHNGMFLRIWLHPLRRQKCVNNSLRGSFLGGISDVQRHRHVRHHWWCKWCYCQYTHQLSLSISAVAWMSAIIFKKKCKKWHRIMRHFKVQLMWTPPKTGAQGRRAKGLRKLQVQTKCLLWFFNSCITTMLLGHR
jgi:hypothetical protein